MLAGHFGSLSRISFHYPATFIYFDTVMTVCRFLRTKKNIKKYKFKQEEVIARVVEGKSSGNTRKSWQDIHRERCCEAELVTSNSLVNYSPFLVLLWIFILIICKSSGKSAMGRKWDTNNET